jgi:hypothetical protein
MKHLPKKSMTSKMPIHIWMEWPSEDCSSSTILGRSAGVGATSLEVLVSFSGFALLDLTDALCWEFSVFRPWPLLLDCCSSIGTGLTPPLAPGGMTASSGSARREWRNCQATFSFRTRCAIHPSHTTDASPPASIRMGKYHNAL